jgi:hypothetical protein
MRVKKRVYVERLRWTLTSGTEVFYGEDFRRILSTYGLALAVKVIKCEKIGVRLKMWKIL